MKLTQLIAIAALLNASIEEVAAVRRHHHHHRPHLVQMGKIDDIHTKDPAFADLQKKKVAVQNAIDEETYEKPLTEDEEKEKFDKELGALELTGKKVSAETKLKDAKKSLAKLEEDEKLEGVPQSQKKVELKKMIAKEEEAVAEVAVEMTKVDAEPVKEKSEKLKDLEKTKKDIEAKQAVEVKALDRVEKTIRELVDKKEEEEDPTDKHIKPKKDTSAYKKNLAAIIKEEEEKEDFIEKRKEEMEAYPKNPAVEKSKQDEELAEEANSQKRKDDYEKQQKLLESFEAKKVDMKKAKKDRDALLRNNAELWTANMPQEYLEGYIQTQVNDIRHQLAQIEAREQDSDSSDSDSESDDE